MNHTWVLFRGGKFIGCNRMKLKTIGHENNNNNNNLTTTTERIRAIPSEVVSLRIVNCQRGKAGCWTALYATDWSSIVHHINRGNNSSLGKERRKWLTFDLITMIKILWGKHLWQHNIVCQEQTSYNDQCLSLSGFSFLLPNGINTKTKVTIASSKNHESKRNYSDWH